MAYAYIPNCRVGDSLLQYQKNSKALKGLAIKNILQLVKSDIMYVFKDTKHIFCEIRTQSGIVNTRNMFL